MVVGHERIVGLLENYQSAGAEQRKELLEYRASVGDLRNFEKQIARAESELLTCMRTSRV